MHKEHSQPNLALRVSLFGVGVKRRAEIDEIDAGIGKLCRFPQPAEAIAEMEPVHIISLGAGVQSSTMALMAAHGEIKPMPVCAIFADTQDEPARVYEWLDWLEKQLPFPIKRCTAGKLSADFLAMLRGEKKRAGQPPFFIANKDGSKGPIMATMH
jgi:hypothetical protein